VAAGFRSGGNHDGPTRTLVDTSTGPLRVKQELRGSLCTGDKLRFAFSDHQFSSRSRSITDRLNTIEMIPAIAGDQRRTRSTGQLVGLIDLSA
jgi:hypothetical protein